MPLDPVELLHQLVAIESHSTQEAAAAAFLVAQMNALGFDAHVDAAGNAVGLVRGESSGAVERELVLLGHVDTVPGHVPVRLQDGRLHGRGSVDAKGPLACFVSAVATATPAPGVTIHVIGAVEEEVASSKGARHRASRHRPEACVIGEPSGFDALTLGYKGCLRLDARFEQPGGHSAGPEGGVPERAFSLWQGLAAYATGFNATRPKLFDQLLPHLRSVDTCSDGLTDTCRMTIGLRLPPDFDTAALKQRAAQLAPGGQLRFYGEEPAWKSTRSTPIARAFSRSFRAHDLQPRFKHKTGTSDMNVLGPAWQCPIVAYGPGDSRLDHTPDEHIVLEEYLASIGILRGALREAGYLSNLWHGLPEPGGDELAQARGGDGGRDRGLGRTT